MLAILELLGDGLSAWAEGAGDAVESPTFADPDDEVVVDRSLLADAADGAALGRSVAAGKEVAVLSVNRGDEMTVERVVALAAAGGSTLVAMENEPYPQRHEQSQAPFANMVPVPRAIAPGDPTAGSPPTAAAWSMLVFWFAER